MPQGLRAMRAIRALFDAGAMTTRVIIAAAALCLPLLARAQASAPEAEFIYHARQGDTLIGITRRLLLEPRRWPQVQSRNNIADPRHIPLGNEIRIPYSWLRLIAETATVMTVSGDVREAGRPLTSGETLPEGTRIETGSDGSVTLGLADGSILTLQKQSVLTLGEMRQVSGVDSAH